MTISFRTATGLSGAADTTAPYADLTGVLPTGHAADDLLLLFYGGKPYTTTPATPAEYTLVNSKTSGTTATGNGTGSTVAIAYSKVHDGSESNPTLTLSSRYEPGMTSMLACYSSLSGGWDVTTGAGSQEAATFDLSVTSDTALEWQVGDAAVVLVVHRDNDAIHVSPSLTASGITFGTLTEQLTTNTTPAGDDGSMYVYTATVSSGSGTVAPTFAVTAGDLQGEAYCSVIFLRLRDGDGVAGAPAAPVAKVEIAFTDGAMAASPTWTDVSAYVDLSRGITLNRGRGRTATAAEPGRCSLTLNNDDGRFTWGDPSGAYGLGMGDQPQLRQPLRVSADVGSGYVPIWTGYVDEWAGGWDGGVRPVVRVTASDRVSRLQLVSLNDGAIMSEVLYDQPVAYYPLDEPAGSTSAGDRSGRQGPALALQSVGAGAGTVDFGSGASPDGVGTVVAFTPSSASNGKRLVNDATGLTSSTTWTVEMWVATVEATGSFLVLSTPVMSSNGVVNMTQSSPSGNFYASQQVGTTLAGIDSGIDINDGAWHHVVATCDGSTVRTYVDGVAGGTVAAASPGTASFGRIQVGGFAEGGVGGAADGQIAHVAVYDSALSAARIAAHYEAGQAAGSFTGDTADERFTRLCRLAGLDAALYASDATATTVLGAQPLGGIGLMDAILQVTDSERGVAYVDGAGVLTYLSSASVSGLTSALTLGPSDVDQDVTLTTNDQELVNDVTVTRPGGATQRRADQASIDSIGQAATTVDTLLSTDAEAGALADLLLSQGLVVHPRTDDLTLDLRAKATTIDADAAVALDTGSRVTVAGLPDGAPASTLELMVTGVAHRITHVEWDLTLTVAPLQTLPAWVLEDATLGVLGVTTRLAYSSATDELLAEAALWLDASAGEV